MENATCTKCGQTKPISEFHRRSDAPCGHASHCKACRKKKAAGYYVENREKILEKTGAYQRADPERSAAYVRKWRAANPDKVYEANQRTIQRDPEAWRERRRKWSRENPDKQRAKNQRRRARYLNAFVADVLLDDLIQRDEGRCGICGQPIQGPIHIDHIIPLVREGTHEPSNCQIAHPLCNQRKSERLPSELRWAA